MEATTCVICKAVFVPYQKRCKTCSRACYRQLDYVKAADSARKKVAEVKERKNAQRRIANNPNRKEVNRKNALARYGLTIEDYDRLMLEQDGCCKICLRQPPKEGWKTVTRLHVDHDHETGKVRALLCNNCNRALGYFQDDPDLLEKAYAYLSYWKAKS